MRRSRFFQFILVAGLFCLGAACTQLDTKENKTPQVKFNPELSPETAMHLLQSTVRVTVGGTTGTGVIVYSKRRSLNLDPRYYSYVLTCAHVVEDANEAFPPFIETFYYLDDNAIVARASFKAEIVAIDAKLDVAVLQIMSPKPLQDCVEILPPGSFFNHRLNDSVYVVGCGLGNEPFITSGNISSFQVNHDVGALLNLDALKMTAATIYGNSGGGVYNHQGLLMGLAQSIDLTHGTPYEHSAYAVPIWSIALFLRENRLGFTVGIDSTNIDEFMAYRARKTQITDHETQEQDFRKSLLDALEKLSNISPVNSITINVSPIISNTNPSISPITSPIAPSVAPESKPEAPKEEAPKKTYY